MIDKTKEQLQEEIEKLNSYIDRLEREKSDHDLLEEKYLRNEKRYKEAQAIGHIGNWAYNIQTENFWGSDEAKKIYGFDLDSSEFTTEEVEKCIPDRGKVHQALIDLIEKDKEYDLEFDIISKDNGTRKTIHSIARIERDKIGNPLTVNGIVSDITGRKQIDQQYIESEERFKFLSQATFEGIVVHRKGFVSDANDSFLKMSGYSRQEAIGKNLLEYIPRLKDRTKILMNIAKRNTKPYTVLARRRDGSRFMAELEAKNSTRSGKQIRIVAVRDVTQRIEVEKNADEIRKRYQNMFNSAPVSIWEEDFSGAYQYIESLKAQGVKDFETHFSNNPHDIAVCSQRVKILDVNKTTLSMFNVKSKKDLLKNLASVFTEESLTSFKEQLISISKGETFYEGKCINKTVDGKLLKVYLRSNTVPGHEKDYSRVLVSLLDETEKEKAIEMLEDTNRQMTAIINDPATFLGIVEPDGTLRTANESALSFIDGHISELKGMKFWDTPWWSHSEELQKKLKESIKQANSGENTHFEADHIGKNGKKIYVNFSIRPVAGSDGDLDSLIVEGLDITSQKLAEEKISNLLSEKEMLLHEVHHRIKNNMATVESLFKIKSMMSKDEKIKTAFQEAISRLSSMRVLYDKLYRSNDFDSISLAEYLPGLAREVITVFPLGSEVKLETDIDNIIIPANVNFPVCIMINELITNTMKYAFNTEIKQKKISLKAKLTNNLVTIFIADNGIGLPENFDLDKSEGYGVKLVKNLAKQIKGEITYKVDNGTSWMLKFNI